MKPLKLKQSWQNKGFLEPKTSDNEGPNQKKENFSDQKIAWTQAHLNIMMSDA